MRILITNDDGINAEGIKHLVEWAKSKGEVTVFAPKFEQSGKGQSIEIHKGYECVKVNAFDSVTAYSVDSTPADCIRVAVLGYKGQYDLVISGINRGFNVGEDIKYSGTAGACFEGAHLGIKSLAISTHCDSFDDAKQNLERAWNYINDNKMFESTDIINVNIPKDPKDILVTKVGDAIYGDDFDFDGDQIIPVLVCYYNGSQNLDLDTDATMNGYISISPVTRELTNLDAYNRLKK